MSKELFSLGEIYPSDFLRDGEEPTTEKVELKLIMDDDGLVRLEKTAPMNKMYGKYWYRSGINATMKDALKDVVDSILKIRPLKGNDVWLDIACNDGTLLSYVPREYYKIGIDPAEDSYKNEAKPKCHYHIQDFFSKENYDKAKWSGNYKVSVITSIAMFYDVPDPKQFIKDVYDILDDDGLWVMQLSYSPLMINQMAFDNICHEHIFYYSLNDIRKLLEEYNFYIEKSELNDVNGGSIRIYIRKIIRYKGQVSPIDHINKFNRNSTLLYETGIDNPKYWIEWFTKIEALKAVTIDFIKNQKSLGKSIWAYGASTKGNTLLQYFGLDNTMIDGIADRNPDKHGLRTIGSNIKIYSEEAMRIAKPDYLLILPWHFKQEFMEREKEYLQKGGKMIFPCPTFEVI
jgi:hypothetical protein